MKIIYKSISWRILMMSTSFLVALIFGLPLGKSLGLTIVLNIINMALYIGHEIIWSYYKTKDGLR